MCIDGGGLKGIIPLQFIRYVESITEEPIHKSFDLIAGTSTGAILTCALAYRKHKTIYPEEREYSLDRIEKIYYENGELIFPYPYHPMQELGLESKNIFRPRFQPKYLESVLDNFLGEQRISSCLKSIFITHYIENNDSFQNELKSFLLNAGIRLN